MRRLQGGLELQEPSRSSMMETRTVRTTGVRRMRAARAVNWPHDSERSSYEIASARCCSAFSPSASTRRCRSVGNEVRDLSTGGVRTGTRCYRDRAHFDRNRDGGFLRSPRSLVSQSASISQSCGNVIPSCHSGAESHSVTAPAPKTAAMGWARRPCVTRTGSARPESRRTSATCRRPRHRRKHALRKRPS